MYNVVAVANFFIDEGLRSDAPDLSANKLHDLVYLAHGWHLGALAKPLLSTPVWAHRDGVFVPELAEAGCVGSKRVEARASLLLLDEARGVMVEQEPQIEVEDPVSVRLAKVWELWGHYSAYDLRAFTREHGAPWDLIWNDESRALDVPRRVPDGTIRLWFRDYLVRRGKVQRLNERLGDTQAILVQPDPNRLRSA